MNFGEYYEESLKFARALVAYKFD